MFLKASAVSFALLLLSRLLGLVRESAQAAAFGTSAMADVAVLMLTLPDWLTGVLVSGALAYVLLPEWARQTVDQQAQTQGRVARWLLVGGGLMAAALYLFQDAVVRRIASGLPAELIPQARLGLAWAAAALPAAMLAALWVTRLQHARDFVGMYAANLVVNCVLILALWVTPNVAPHLGTVSLLGMFLWVAMGLRLLWLHWRLRACAPAHGDIRTRTVPLLPHGTLWLWAALSAGLPLMLPFVARSFASVTGAGGLATFNYAWKLVELPLVLAIQLVATLTFPAITQAMAGPLAPAGPQTGQSFTAPAIRAIRGAFLLAWTAACAAVAALQVGASTVAAVLFGWGRMSMESLDHVAAWGRVGSWSLLPQALIAVALTVLAVQGRMRTAVVAYGLALAGLLAWGSWFTGGGADLMAAIGIVLSAVAALVVSDLHQPKSGAAKRFTWLPWQAMAIPAVALMGFTVASQRHGADFAAPAPLSMAAIAYCVLAACSVVAITYLTSAELRAALRR